MEPSNTQSNVSAVIVQQSSSDPKLDANNAKQETPQQQKKSKGSILLSLAIVTLLAGLYYYFTSYQYIESTNDAYVKADLTWISPKIEGNVLEILVDNNEVVKQSQMLVKIEDDEISVRKEIAEANLRGSLAALKMQEYERVQILSELERAKAHIRVAEAEYSRMKLELERYEVLLSHGVTSRQNFELISSQYSVASANVAAAVEEMRAAEARLLRISTASNQTQAEIDAAEANIKLLTIDKTSTSIVAPVAGVVGNLELETGSRVFPQSRLLAIVPQGSAYIEANFKETQIHRMSIGQQVKVKIDAYPGRVFDGHIESFSPAAGIEFAIIPVDNATGNFNKIVQRIPVKIRVDNIDAKVMLRPGLSAIVTVDTRQ
ncbi:membrane fusion protein, multidrug efflux system [Thalassolituus maritimus]|uniref:Membrane fusion protein, multidrug efflux system n=1 Tax=Thalassolituus maritimus TaxID=484498 RepID=A0A1N7Q9F1_9GAMM|nr:HlyD family secretion protein [Thalassolituus maritimus]SIT19492.1 membrane fusion protein, multidrug efflux system [Thalassolituus maritimus]